MHILPSTSEWNPYPSPWILVYFLTCFEKLTVAEVTLYQLKIRTLRKLVALVFALLASSFPVRKHGQDFWVMKDWVQGKSQPAPQLFYLIWGARHVSKPISDPQALVKLLQTRPQRAERLPSCRKMKNKKW